MKKLFFSLAMLALPIVSFAQNTCEGWPANYGGVMLQGFWWDSYNETKWTALTSRADELSEIFDLIWIPQAGTTSGGKYNENNNIAGYPSNMGYEPCYWLEYNTCFGTEAELKTMIDTYKSKGTGIIEDVVVNHKGSMSGWGTFPNESRTGAVSNRTYSLTWDYKTDICSNDEANYDDASDIKGQITGNTDTGDGFSGIRDLDHTSQNVQNNIKTYIDYLKNEMGFAGFRYDMVKGFGAQYIGIYNNSANPTFSVGEYWDNQEAIQNWINGTGKTSAAFDFALKFKLNTAISGGDYSALVWKSFTADANYSRYSVTFADNHDTFRDASKLQYNWSAANAFILAMPGTPCVFFKHYEADKTNIRAMILARKACGITNQTAIKQQYAVDDNSGYVLETEGSKGSVMVHLGSAANYATPDGYTLVASGDSYKFYQKIDVTSDFASTPTYGKYTVYFDKTGTNWTAVTAYVWNDANEKPSNWPGTSMELTPQGFYKYTFDSKYNHIIFNNGYSGGTNQTANLESYNNRVYNYNGTTGEVMIGTGENALLFTGYANRTGNNVVLKSGDQYTCANLIITDKVDFTTPINFNANSASYTRAMPSSNWGTLTLPYALSANNGDCTFYTLSQVGNGKLTFQKVTSDIIPAGTPIAFKKTEGKTQVSFAEQNVNVSNSILQPSPVDGWTMNGSFTNQSLTTEGLYYVAKDHFYEKTEGTPLSLVAFRSYFSTTNPSAKIFSIAIENDEETAINPIQPASDDIRIAIYDLQGRKLSTTQKGINIIRMSNGTTQKITIK